MFLFRAKQGVESRQTVHIIAPGFNPGNKARPHQKSPVRTTPTKHRLGLIIVISNDLEDSLETRY